MTTIEELAQAQIEVQRERFACRSALILAAARVADDPMNDALCIELSRATYALRSAVQNLDRIDRQIIEAEATR